MARPNIVFIMADDLGYGELGCYGQEWIRTPRLDRMAAEGVRLTQFYSSAPVCAPARCQLMTGLHAGHAYVRDNREVQPEGQAPIPDDAWTMAEALRACGYVTGATGKWGLGPPRSEGDPVNQGFDFFYGYNCQRQAHNYYPTHLWRNQVKEVLAGNVAGNLVGEQYAHDLIIDEALGFIRREQDGPFFLYVPVTIPHVALQVPEDSLASYAGVFDEVPYEGNQGYLPHPEPHGAYAAMVSRLDRDVGRILDLLAELDLEENTLVIFTSDNGPTHGRVGGADSAFFHSTAGLRGLKGSVYEGGIRVPFVARWPGVIEAGRVEPCAGVGYDMMPTLLAIAGGAAPEGLDGVDLSATILGRGVQGPRPWIYWEFPGYGGQQALRFGDIKAVRRGLHKGPVVTEIYDLSADAAETTDLASQRPDLVERAEAIMRGAHRPSPLFPFPALDAPGE
ncbi:MAG: arylsulfatase [Phycisphaerales bacterium]|nr:arylsulfatase [Phycisphaerales bacterium]